MVYNEMLIMLLTGIQEVLVLVPATQYWAISSETFLSPIGKVCRSTVSPLLERPVKKYISSIVGVRDCPSIIKASASGCQYSTKAFSSLGYARMNGHRKIFINPHCINVAITAGSAATAS
jgi:hypothetical protein